MNAYQKAAKEAGGTRPEYTFSLRFGPNGGCGAPTHVAGTNGGVLPCGSWLRIQDVSKPYYCGACQRDLHVLSERQLCLTSLQESDTLYIA